MKKTNLFLIALLSGLLFTFNSCEKDNLPVFQDDMKAIQIEKPEIAGKGVKSGSVNGQGFITEAEFGEDVYNRRFSFHANTMPDGSVTGKAVITYIGGEAKVMINIDCMAIDGNSAKLSGTVISNTTNPGTVDSSFVFKVIDNGEGENADTDQISWVYFSSLTCADSWDAPMWNIDGGNIQVK